MTKSGKHKKEFRKEKNKIKLKLSAQSKAIIKGGKGKKGKKGGLLPKGLNVTDTSFKTKKRKAKLLGTFCTRKSSKGTHT